MGKYIGFIKFEMFNEDRGWDEINDGLEYKFYRNFYNGRIVQDGSVFARIGYGYIAVKSYRQQDI